jgi:hypothetical protein
VSVKKERKDDTTLQASRPHGRDAIGDNPIQGTCHCTCSVEREGRVFHCLALIVMNLRRRVGRVGAMVNVMHG